MLTNRSLGERLEAFSCGHDLAERVGAIDVVIDHPFDGGQLTRDLRDSAELLPEVDEWTGFTRHFNHLKSGEVPKDKTLRLTAILADGINLGLTKMAEACPGVTYAKLSWLQAWHVRDETYSATLAELVNEQHRRPFALNLVVAAIILWNKVYLERATHALRAHNQPVDDDLLQHVSPLGWEHINLTGDSSGGRTNG